MMYDRPNIELVLNSFAFKGNDLDEILQNSDADFQSNYYPRIALQNYPAAVSEMFISLAITFAGSIGAAIATGALNETGKDIYKWLKSFRSTIIKKEFKQESNIEIVFKDVSINSFSENHEEFINLFEDFEQIAKKIDAITNKGESSHVSVYFDSDAGWKIEVRNKE